MAFLKKLMGLDSGLPVIMITGHGDVPMAVEAMRVGAYDFLEKPFNPDRMTELAKRATPVAAPDAGQPGAAPGTVGRLDHDEEADRRIAAMERLREDILDLGQADGHVLIDGETGTGKTLVAHALHAVGPRAGKKFVDDVLRGLVRGSARPPTVRSDGGGRSIPLGGRGARRDAGAGGYRGAEPAVAGAAADLHQRSGTPAETRIIAICNDHEQGRTVEDALRPDLYLPACRAEDHSAAAAVAGRGYPDAVHAPGRAVCRGIRLRRPAGDGAGGSAAAAGALAGQCAPADQYGGTRGAAEPPRHRVDRVAADGGQRGDWPGT